MVQLVYQNGLKIYGSLEEVLQQIRELSKRFDTVAEVLAYYACKS